MRRMKKRGPNVLYDLNDLLFFLTTVVMSVGCEFQDHVPAMKRIFHQNADECFVS